MIYIKKMTLLVSVKLVRLCRFLTFKTKYIFVLPPAGSGSLGDEAMLSGLYNLINFSNKDQTLRQANYSYRIAFDCHGLDKNIIYISVADTLAKLSFLRNLIWCQHFLVVGADIIDGVYSHETVEDIVSFCNLAVRSGIPATILGFSFSNKPSEKAVEALKKLAPQVTCFCRDPISLKRFEEKTGHKAQPAADLAFHMKEKLEGPSAKTCAAWIFEQKKDGKLIVGININRLITDGIEIDAVKIYAAEFTTLMERNANISCVFLPHDLRKEISDFDFLNILKNHMPDRFKDRIYLPNPPYDSWDIKALAGMADLIISGRMHLTIAALSQAVPAVGIIYNGKFEGLYNFFNVSELLFDPEGLSEQGALARHIENIIPKLDQYQKNIEENISMVKELATKNVKYL